MILRLLLKHQVEILQSKVVFLHKQSVLLDTGAYLSKSLMEAQVCTFTKLPRFILYIGCNLLFQRLGISFLLEEGL